MTTRAWIRVAALAGLGLLAAATALATASPASAQTAAEGAPDPAARAIELGKEGMALFAQRKWPEALERFRAAESLYHSPVFLLYAARCLRNTGRLLEAKRDLRQLDAQELGGSAPKPWHDAQRDGREELAALDSEIPRLTVVVRGGSAQARVSIDDRSTAERERIELDPGEHRVVAQDARRTASKTVTLERGGAESTVTLELAPPTVTPAKAKPRRPRPSPHRSTETGPSVTGLVLLGTGGAALLAGGVFGALALAKGSEVTSDLPESCVDRTCPESRRAAIEADSDRARDLATVSNVLLIGGAAVAAAGAVVLLTHPSRTPAASARAGAGHGSLAIRFAGF